MIVACPSCSSRYDVTGRPPGTRAHCRCGHAFVLPDPPQSAGRLTCPSCGGAVPPTAHGCPFCATPLRVKACPKCFARIFHGSPHCDQCGGDVVAPANADPDGRASALCCPRCAGMTLEARLVEETLIDECPGCHGVWIDATALDRVLTERGQNAVQALATMTPRESVPASTGGALGPQGYVKCPECANVMNRSNFGRRSGVIVDVCRAHGTWFDSDELPRVIQFVMKGGLQDAQRRELERLKDEVRVERFGLQLEAQRDRLRADPGSMRSADALAGLLGSIGSLWD